MDKCSECGEYVVPWESHKCNPVWHVWHESDDEDGCLKIYATDAEDAAHEWAERSDDDHEMIKSNGEYVYVKSPDGEITKWIVTAEICVSYYATESTDDTPPKT